MKRLFLLLFALLPMLVLAQGVTPFRYDTVQKFSDGTAIVVHNGKYGLIKTGKVIVPPEYKEIKRIADDKYLLTSNGLSIADSKGNIANDVMLYTSSDEQIVSPRNKFDANIVSNTYSDGLGVIVFNKPVTEIVDYAFYDCTSLTSVTIPDSVTEIGWFAFARCTSLTSITIPNSVTEIGWFAFEDCSSLTSITIPNSVTEIGACAFEDCTSLPVIDDIHYADTYLVEAVDKTRTSYAIKPGTRFIGSRAFRDCTSLTSVTIPNSVTSIEYEAFEGCTSLPVIDGIRYADTCLVEVVDKTRTSYSIKPGTRLIGVGAFADCTSLKTFYGKYASSDNRCLIVNNSIIAYANASGSTYSIPNSVTEIEGNAFSDCTSLTSITIPNSVTKIESYTFRGCTSLTSIVIPNSVTEIGRFAFEDCSSLTSVTIPNSVTEIEACTFEDCTSLTSIVIPNSVTEIGACAFEDCTSLTSIVIPNSVTKIEWGVFDDCTSLKEVYCKPKTPPTAAADESDWSAFSDNASGRKIYVPRASVEAYKQAAYWKEYVNDIVGYDF